MLSIYLRKAFRFLVVFMLGLTLINFVVQVFRFLLGYDNLLGLVRLFDVNTENSVPTWYSSIALLLCSLLLWLISVAKGHRNDRFVSHWKGLSIIFLFLSLDEVASLHELVIPFGRSINSSGFLYYFWVVPGMIFVTTVALIYRKFLIALPTKIRYLFLIAGIVFVSGSVGLEMVGGYYFESNIGENIHTASELTNFSMAVLLALEEFLEMLGVLIFIYALLLYIKMSSIDIDIFSFECNLDSVNQGRQLRRRNFSGEEPHSEEI